MDTSAGSVRANVETSAASRSIVVAVNGGESGWRALDWAAAESAARQARLRIVHVVTTADSAWLSTQCGAVAAAQADRIRSGTALLDLAAARARQITAETMITTHLEFGSIAGAIRDAGQLDALIVVGRGRSRFGAPSVGRRIAQSSGAPVAVVDLDDRPRCGPSAGRVVVGMGGCSGGETPLLYAFEAAARRGVGLTVVRHSRPHWTASARIASETQRSSTALALEIALYRCLDAYPCVDIRQLIDDHPAGGALVAQSEAAALVVVGASGRCRLHRALLGSVADTVLRWGCSPLAVVPAVSKVARS